MVGSSEGSCDARSWTSSAPHWHGSSLHFKQTPITLFSSRLVTESNPIPKISLSQNALLKWISMRSARYQLAVVVSIALTTGLFYSQVCALNCTVYGCLTAASATQQGDQAGHCHEQESEPVPSKPGDEPDCPAHAELSALISSTVITVGTFSLSLHAQAATPEIGLMATRPAGEPRLAPDQSPFRAPPAHSILRI